jgi:HAD superfamily hydrolase (TIGR01509 family)
MTIRAVFFDLGGVILRTTDKTPRTRLGERFGMSYDEMDNFVFECPTAIQASIGAISEDDHWLDVTRRLNLAEREMPALRDAFFGGDTVDWNIVNFLRSIRKTHKTGLISNAWDGLRPWIVKQQFADAFDVMVISAEVHNGKPAPEIFHYAFGKLNVKAEEAVFVDDVQKNISACEALGMQGILFQTSEQTLEKLKTILAL